MKIRSVEFLGSVVDATAQIPSPDLPHVAFAGRSNVGKSSLINTLLRRTKRKVARISGTPGKTRELNFYRVNDQFVLVDLPGFGFARVPDSVREGWKRLVEGFLARPDGPRAVVHLVDVRREPMPDDLRMLEYLAELGLPTLVAFTKVDKLSRSERSRMIPDLTRGLSLSEDQVIPFSSKTGEGRDLLAGALLALIDEE